MLMRGSRSAWVFDNFWRVIHKINRLDVVVGERGGQVYLLNIWPEQGVN